MTSRARLLAVAAALVPLAWCADAEAIPFARRIALRGEAALGFVLPADNPYTAGMLVHARLGLLLFEPLTLQVSVTEGIFPSRNVPTSPCAEARKFDQRARDLGVPMQVLPEALQHGEINADLGLPSAYTRSVSDWIDRRLMQVRR